MTDNRNSCSKAAAAVGQKSFLHTFENYVEGILYTAFLAYHETGLQYSVLQKKKNTLWMAIVRHSSDMPRPPKL